MGLPSDVYVANRQEADALPLEHMPDLPPSAGLGRPFDTALGLRALVAERLDPVKLATLEHLLTERPVGELLGPVAYHREPGPDGPWLVSVRSSLTDALAKVPRGQTAGLAEAWAQTDEWLADRGDAGLLEPLVEGLAELAREARARDRELYLLLSL
ncbi:MAG: hypothetical protein ACXW4H_06530 [Candidatus Limnocylindrales bacterium]